MPPARLHPGELAGPRGGALVPAAAAVTFELRLVRWIDGYRVPATHEVESRAEAELLLQAERLGPGELAYVEIVEIETPHQPPEEEQ